MMNGCNIWCRNRRGARVIIRQELLNSSCAAKMILEGYLSSHHVNNDPVSICDKPGSREQHVLSSLREERGLLMFAFFPLFRDDNRLQEIVVSVCFRFLVQGVLLSDPKPALEADICCKIQSSCRDLRVPELLCRTTTRRKRFYPIIPVGLRFRGFQLENQEQFCSVFLPPRSHTQNLPSPEHETREKRPTLH